MIGGAAPLRVLVVDDEPAICRFLRTSLSTQGYQVSEAENGLGALDELRRGPVDILVLDLGLPDIDGLDIIESVRGQGSAIPIIVLSSRTDETNKVKALDLGADDYVTKPFGIDELLARIRAALRHRLQQAGEQPVFRCGELSMDLVRRIVRIGGQEVHLTPREYDLLRLFVAHAGKVLTHRFILREIWGGEGDVQYLRVYIRALRQKIEPDPNSRATSSPSRVSAIACAPPTDPADFAPQEGLSPLEVIDLITPSSIIASLLTTDKSRLLRELAARATRALPIDSQTVLDALHSREMLGSTGVGQAIALPHARIPGLHEFFGLFARLERPIEFEAIDERPVDLVFLLLIPEQAGDDHLAALACVSRKLRNPAVAQALRTRKTAPELYEVLTVETHTA